MKLIKIGLVGLVPLIGNAQTVLYVPSGVVGTASGQRVGVGTSAPAQKLSVLVADSNPSNTAAESVAVVGSSGKVTAFGNDATYGWLQSYNAPLYVNPAGNDVILNANGYGGVGIGTANPVFRLDVQQASNDTTIRALSTTAGAWFVADSAADGYFGLALRSSGTPKWFVGSYGTADFTIKRGHADGAELLRIVTNGNVGIGTTFGDLNGPTGLLSVSKSSPVEGTAIVRIEGRNVGHTNYSLISAGHGSGQTFVVKADGKVGIGTASPTHALSVSGSIRTKEVIVETTGWSDYVFAKDYKLAALCEVERQIQQSGHLPGVPSAADLDEKGVNVGSMQALLLAKIEELTLHLIAQEKRLTAQDAKIEAQAVELARLRAVTP
jgi:hypothetical protein